MSANGLRERCLEERPGAVLITGGAGFIGTNLAHHLLGDGRRVVVFDNLARPGVEQNLRWLRAVHPRGLTVEIGDIRDPTAVARVVRTADHVVHLAAQVAVTTSLVDPRHDFQVNAQGTLNLLEALRTHPSRPSLIFTSTNKVYGSLSDIALRKRGARYEPADVRIQQNGIDESRSVDFHSPYGCSKGAADQYVLDYARTFNLRTVVFRMSCIYGLHQLGTEDQGWVAHFLIRAIEGRPITIFGDGSQVRDVLFIDDLVDALLLAERHASRLSGQAFNIGGGPTNTTSLVELLDLIAELHGERPDCQFLGWRAGDQRYYVSDPRKFHIETGWTPRIGLRDGVERLYGWLVERRVRPRHRELRAGVLS